MLILPIKRKWFDMILSGEKKEEYRDIKPYYDTRLMDAFGMIWVGDELIRAPMPELQKNRVQLVAFCFSAVPASDMGKMYRQYGQSAHYRPDMAGKNGEQNQERNIIF